MATVDTIHKFIAEVLTRDGDTLQDTDSLIEDGIIDSFGVMALIEFVEQTFSVRIEGRDLTRANFQSIQAVTALVELRMK